MSTNRQAIITRNLVKTYQRGNEEIKAVNGISLSIENGDFVAFTGPSGSGKTTLINILGCLDNPDTGELTIAGKNIFNHGKILSEVSLTKIRREIFGYIFQKFYLIPTLTVRENIVLPFTFYKKEGAVENAENVMRILGIEKRADHLPGQISGGEMQRVAIARALVNKPKILLADEPTGNLDVKRSNEIGEILQTLNRQEDLTVILVTHNLELAGKANHIFELHDGRLL